MTLHNGVDPVSGRKVGLETGDPRGFRTYEELYAAFMRQIHYFVDMKVRVSNYIDRMFAKYAPATFLSTIVSRRVRITTIAGLVTTPLISSVPD